LHQYFHLLYGNLVEFCLVPKALTKQQTAFIYATEADVLNMALFGKTAKQFLHQYFHLLYGNLVEFC
jgi:hypothetical protein